MKTRFAVRRRQFESVELAKIKKSLDLKSENLMSERAKRQRKARVEGAQSDAKAPIVDPTDAWALRSEDEVSD